MNLVVGRVTTNPRGFGLWTPNVRLKAAPPASTSPARTSIRPCTAIVVVRVERSRDENRAEGQILRILERGTASVVGRYEVDGQGRGFVVPFDRRLVMDVEVLPGESMRAALAKW